MDISWCVSASTNISSDMSCAGASRKLTSEALGECGSDEYGVECELLIVLVCMRKSD